MTEKTIKLKIIENLNNYYRFKSERNKLQWKLLRFQKMINLVNNNIQIVHQRINSLNRKQECLQ
jgi:hypothetical protein